MIQTTIKQLLLLLIAYYRFSINNNFYIAIVFLLRTYSYNCKELILKHVSRIENRD